MGNLGLDWLTVGFAVRDLPAVQAVIEDWWPPGEPVERGSFRYRRAIYFAPGVEIFYSPGPDGDLVSGRQDAIAVFRGAPLADLSREELMRFLWALLQVGVHATRVDVRYDDTAKRVRPADLREYVQQGQVSGARVCEFYSGADVGGKSRGDTLYLGKRGKWGGGACLCVYDKDIQSSGRIDAVRWEARYYGELASDAFTKLAGENGQTLEQKLGGLVYGRWTFYARKDDRNLSRNPLAPWFASMVEECGRIRLRATRRDVEVDRAAMEKHVRRSCGRALAWLREYWRRRGDDGQFVSFCQSAADAGFGRLTPAELQLLPPDDSADWPDMRGPDPW